MTRRVSLIILTAVLWACAGQAFAMESGPCSNPDHEFDLLVRQEQAVLEQRGVILHDASLTRYLQTVADKLWEQIPTALDPPVVMVIADPRLQAFTYPNGYCYLSTGILALASNEDQLAMIVSHELVHYAHQDSVKLYSHIQTTSFKKNGIQAGHWHRAVASRGIKGEIDAAEQRADEEGLSILRKSGYCEREAAALMHAFMKTPQIQGDPESEAYFKIRAQFMEAQLAHVDSRSCCSPETPDSPDAYWARIAPALMANARAALQGGDWDQADDSVSKFMTWKPDDARANYIKGELLRRRNDDAGKKQCIGYYEKALRNDPGFSLAYRALGELHFKAGRYDAARPYFETFLSLAPRDDASKYIEGYLDRCSTVKP